MLQNDSWSAELEKIAEILHKAPLEKSIKWGAEVFTFNGKNVVSYGGFRHYFAIWFFNGVFLSDPYGVLVNAQEGKTKSLRQWRFTSIKEIHEKKVLEYVKEAIAVEEKGLKMKPEKFRPAPAPLILSEAFSDDKRLKSAFDKLTPGRQKEYILYLEEARQEKTKQSRMEKIKPMILNGQGLNDRYK